MEQLLYLKYNLPHYPSFSRTELYLIFLYSRLLSGPPDAFALQAGTIWTGDDEFRFFLALPVGNTGEMQTMEAILHTPSSLEGPEFEFCKECVWTVVVQFKERGDSDSNSLVDNLIMHHTFRRQPRKTVSVLFRCAK